MENIEQVSIEQLPAIQRLDRDLKEASYKLKANEARFLVDAYYMLQENRIRNDGQVRSMVSEPHAILGWLADQNRLLERQLQVSLDVFSYNHPVGYWARTNKGVGPVIAAGLLAHIDIEKAPTAGHIWNYAGLNPEVKWIGSAGAQKIVDEHWPARTKIDDEIRVKLAMAANIKPAALMDLETREDVKARLAKRPWNAELKKLCWKLGESFVKVSGSDDAFYGRLYRERKMQEIERNERGEFKEQAALQLKLKNYGKSTDAYKAYITGKLPPAHLHARAKRAAVKMFLSHFHQVWFYEVHGKQPPRPYALEHLDHAHMIECPNWPY